MQIITAFIFIYTNLMITQETYKISYTQQWKFHSAGRIPLRSALTLHYARIHYVKLIDPCLDPDFRNSFGLGKGRRIFDLLIS